MDKLGDIDIVFIILFSFIIGVAVVFIFDDPTTAFVIWITASILSAFIIMISRSIVEDMQEAKLRAREKDKREKFLEKRSKLQSKEEYKLVSNFVKKYRKILKDSYPEAIPVISDLKDLLKNKGFDFDIIEIGWLIFEELESQRFINFKTNILNRNPSTLREYMDSLLEIYGDNYLNYFNIFKRLIGENEMRGEISDGELVEKLEKIKKEMELDRFERKLTSEKLDILSVNDLDSMNGYEFEEFLKILFEKMGYKVEHTALSGDQGADLILSKFGEKVVVQAKRYSDKVSNTAIQEATAAIKHYGADRGMVVTTGEYTPSARELAESNNIELIDRAKLERLLIRVF